MKLTVEETTLILSILNFILMVFNATVIAGLFIFIKFVLDKKLKKFDYLIGDAGELNRKMHDRLVEVEELIENGKPIPGELKKRLKMNLSRLSKHDPTIETDITQLLKTYEKGFFGNGVVNFIGFTEVQEKSLKLIPKIKEKIDKLVK